MNILANSRVRIQILDWSPSVIQRLVALNEYFKRVVNGVAW